MLTPPVEAAYTTVCEAVQTLATTQGCKFNLDAHHPDGSDISKVIEVDGVSDLAVFRRTIFSALSENDKINHERSGFATSQQYLAGLVVYGSTTPDVLSKVHIVFMGSRDSLQILFTSRTWEVNDLIDC